MTDEQRHDLLQAKHLAQQAVGLIDGLRNGDVVQNEALGGAVWRLLDAAGLVGLVAEKVGARRKSEPTGRGFALVDVYDHPVEQAERSDG